MIIYKKQENHIVTFQTFVETWNTRHSQLKISIYNIFCNPNGVVQACLCGIWEDDPLSSAWSSVTCR